MFTQSVLFNKTQIKTLLSKFSTDVNIFTAKTKLRIFI